MVRMISDSIGHDGNSFFCRRCFKAGYRLLAAVKGHLAMCPGTAIQKGALPASCSQLPTGQGVGLGDLGQPAAAASRSWVGGALFQGSGELASYQQEHQQLGQLQPASNYQQLAAIQQEQETQRQRINRLMNEYSHMVYATNAPSGGIDKKWILVGAFVLVLLFLSTARNCPPCESGMGRSSRSSNLKDRVIGKASDKAIDYIFRGL